MNIISKHKSGLAVGSFLGLWHLVWSLLVASGLAQPLVDWIFRIHFIQPFYIVGSFNLGGAILLVVVTSAIGYVFGWLLAAIWNKLHSAV